MKLRPGSTVIVFQISCCIEADTALARTNHRAKIMCLPVENGINGLRSTFKQIHQTLVCPYYFRKFSIKSMGARHITEQHSTKPKLSCFIASKRKVSPRLLVCLIFQSHKSSASVIKEYSYGGIAFARTDKVMKAILQSIFSRPINSGITLRPSVLAKLSQPVSTTVLLRENRYSSKIYVCGAYTH